AVIAIPCSTIPMLPPRVTRAPLSAGRSLLWWGMRRSTSPVAPSIRGRMAADRSRSSSIEPHNRGCCSTHPGSIGAIFALSQSPARPCSRRNRLVVLAPVLGHRKPAAKPHAFDRGRVLDEAFDALRARGMPGQPVVQADRHEFGMGFALATE